MTRAGSVAAAVVLAALAAAVAGAPASAQPHVSFDPGAITVQPGQQFDMSFRVGACGDSIASFQLYTSFDPTVVELVAATEGSLYVESGYMTWFIAEEEEDGFWHFFDTVFGAGTYILPPGELLHLRFRALACGHTQAHVDTVRMTDVRRNALPIEGFEHGEIFVVPASGVGEDKPTSLTLGPARPNPFTGSTKVPFSAPLSRGPMTAEVYDILGRVVAEIPVGASDETVVWDGRCEGGRAAPSAVYFIRVTVGGGEARTSVVKVR